MTQQSVPNVQQITKYAQIDAFKIPVGYGRKMHPTRIFISLTALERMRHR